MTKFHNEILAKSSFSKLKTHKSVFRDLQGKTRLLEKNESTICFLFVSYECCQRQVSLIKMIDGVDEVLILLFTAFVYEYLF